MKDKQKRSINSPDPTMGPFGFTIASIKSALAGLGALFKHPKMLILTLVITVVQTALAYLKLLLPTSELVKYASLITFAQGGMYAGLLGAVGGVIGKGFYTWFINDLVFSAFKPKVPKQAKVKEPKTKGAFGLVLLGLGLALVVYNFMSGNASLENSVIGVTAMFASFQTLKKKNGFMVGFICSFTKGRMTRTAAGIVIKGMIVGFFFGVLSSLKFSGIWCYLAGVAFLVLALVFLMTRRRMVVAAVAIIVMMGSVLPVLGMLQVTDRWVSVQEAYGIKGDTLSSYIELTNAVSAAPPLNMELTLIAMGARSFDESVPIEQQKIIVEDGESGTFSVAAQFEDFSFNSLVSLHLEADGYYASASTAYSANNSWTQNEVEEGTYQADTLSYFTFRHLGTASYLYEPYLEAGKFYMEISIPFGYGDMLGQGQVSSATQILARVDLVKRDGGISETDTPSGYWELKERLMYVVIQESNSRSTTENINGQYIGDAPSDKARITIEGNVIDYVSRRTTVVQSGEVYTEHNYQIVFGQPPSLLKAFDVLEISFDQTHAFYDSQTNQTTENKTPFGVVGFLPNRRADSFTTKLNDGDVMTYPFGADLGQTWFSLQNGTFIGNVPPGKVAGEVMTLEMGLGFHEPYDSTVARVWEFPVIAYVYEWKGGVIPPAEDEEEDEAFWGEDAWDEHANEEETGVISAAAALAGLVGAAAAAAGLAGGFGGSGYIKKDDEGDYVVHDPVTGEERVYIRNKETGRYHNPLTGAEYTEAELENSVASRAENAAVLGQDYAQSEQAKQAQRLANQKLSRAEHDLKQENKMRATQRDLEQKGKDGDEFAAAMARQLQKINTQKRQTGRFSQKDFEQFKRTHGLWTRGSLAGNSGLPKAESEWDIFKQGLANTGEEIARGESNKAIALRVAVSLLTGSFVARGALSAAAAAVGEAGLELAQAGFTMKDYVEKGGNDWKEGAQQAIVKTLQGEAIGRTFGLGLGALGKGTSKLGQILSKSKAGKIIVDKIADLGEKAGRVLTANVGDVPNVMRQIAKESSESALAKQMANAGVRKLSTKAGSLDDLANKRPASKAVGSSQKIDTQKVVQAQTPSKQTVSKPKDGVLPKDTDAYKRVSQEVDEALSKAEKHAADRIEKFRNDVKLDPELKARNDAHLKGKEEGLEAVNKLDQARQKLANNPDSPEVKKELEQAVMNVQKNKHAQKVINEKELASNATRSDFNGVKVKKDAVISLNTSERIAVEFGLDPKSVSNVQATNNMNTAGVGDIKGVAGEAVLGKPIKGTARKFTENDLDLANLEKKGGDKISVDLDQTYRVEIKMKDGSIEVRDLSARKIKQIQNEEVYKEWNDGKLPMKNGEIDHNAVEEFAEEMDYTVVDARSPDAYGTVGDLQQALKNDGSVRQYGDAEAVSRTIKYKSDEWTHIKAQKKLEANRIVAAEGDVAEGIRQGTKQYDSQLVYQVKAINAKEGATKLVIPPKLAEGMSVLKQIGHGKGKLSPAEAEAVLKRMGTSTEDVLRMNSEQTEFINRVIARRFKDE